MGFKISMQIEFDVLVHTVSIRTIERERGTRGIASMRTLWTGENVPEALDPRLFWY